MTSYVESQKPEDTCSYQFTRADHHVAVSVVCKKKEPYCVLCQFIEVEIETLYWQVENMSLAERCEDLGQTLYHRIPTTQPGSVYQGQVDSGCAVLADIGNKSSSEFIKTNSASLEITEESEREKVCKLESAEVMECGNKNDSGPLISSPAVGSTGPGQALEMPSTETTGSQGLSGFIMRKGPPRNSRRKMRGRRHVSSKVQNARNV